MPQRQEPFLNDNIYHVFNRTIEGKKIFQNSKYSSLFLDTMSYYFSTGLEMSYSKLKRLDDKKQNLLLKNLKKAKDYRVSVLAYCLMPTHFHMLLKQEKDNGIPRFISDTVNSFTRRYNLENKRRGPLFLPKFKSTSISTDEQLINVTRYIHLNPYSSGLVGNIYGIDIYPWSSFKEYTDGQDIICSTDYILGMFNNNCNKYKEFVYDNADYQKNLELLKYLDNW